LAEKPIYLSWGSKTTSKPDCGTTVVETSDGTVTHLNLFTAEYDENFLFTKSLCVPAVYLASGIDVRQN
jgi:hypothetical protein